MSWRDDIYSDTEKALLREVERLREVIRELEEENEQLKEALKLANGD